MRWAVGHRGRWRRVGRRRRMVVTLAAIAPWVVELEFEALLSGGVASRCCQS